MGMFKFFSSEAQMGDILSLQVQVDLQSVEYIVIVGLCGGPSDFPNVDR
jgi:hypothetical protein